MSEPTSGPASGVVALEVFTDEELSILDFETQVVITPHLDAVDAAQRDTVRATAYRSLIARGIIDPPSAEAVASATVRDEGGIDGATVQLRVREDVLSTITLRTGAPALVAISRTTSASQDYWYAHVISELVLLEEVSADGLHRFALARTLDLPELVVRAAVAPDSTDGEGAELTLAGEDAVEPPAELVEQLGRAWLRADVVVRSRGEDPEAHSRLTGVFTGPDGSWSVVADRESRTVTATPESVEDLRERLRALALEAIAAGVVEVGA